MGKRQQSAERHRQKGQRCDRRLCAPCREHKPGAQARSTAAHSSARLEGLRGEGEAGAGERRCTRK